MNIIKPMWRSVEPRRAMGLRLQQALRDTREGKVRSNDTGLHSGDFDTQCVMGFFEMVDRRDQQGQIQRLVAR